MTKGRSDGRGVEVNKARMVLVVRVLQCERVGGKRDLKSPTASSAAPFMATHALKGRDTGHSISSLVSVDLRKWCVTKLACFTSVQYERWREGVSLWPRRVGSKKCPKNKLTLNGVTCEADPYQV